MSEPTRSIRLVASAVLALGVAAVVGTGGCSHSSTMPGVVASPTPTPSGSPTPTPSPTPTANVFVSMHYAGASPTTDPVYGEVDGYALISPPPTPVSSPTPTPSPAPSPTATQTPGPSGIVDVACNENIQFLNFDTTSLHTASLLSSTGFPPLYNNENGLTSSPLLTSISSDQFSSGAVAESTATIAGRSLVYTTGSVPGAYYFGDWYDYNENPSMRTVIVINC
ncbi:MAG TPA: hypothetical protein VEJ20_02235 [Candidatus Eremiobacteraceae bacterium]|nr:hypothetical protein [Candidatus Eremiobacteraceae bacterium]